MLRNLPLSASGRLRLLIGVTLCSQLLMPTFAMADPAYDALIIQARNGNFTPALTQLRQWPAERQTPGQISDHLVIAGWAGQDAEVLKVYEAQGQNRNLTAQALATVARTYRNQKQWAQAEAVYRKALLREPNNVDLQLGLALTEADGGKASEAVQRTRALVAAKPDDPNRRMALGYALTRTGLQYDALFEFDQAFIRAGDKPEVAREYVVALQKARLPQPALRLSAQRPGLVDPVTQRRLEGDLAAERVRIAEFATRTEKERYVIADRALQDYDKLLARWTPDATAHDDVVIWRIDRLGALKARARTAEVIREYETLQAEGVRLPTYAKRWVAASYLDQRLPEKAAPLYREALDAPDADVGDRVEDTTALFYALLENDQVDEARAVAKHLADTQKPRVELKGLPIGNPNDEWMDAQQLSAQAGTYGADLPSSEKALDDLVSKAPGSIGLRLAQAEMYRARDWPRRAERSLKETEAQAPRDIGLEVSQAYTALDLQEWRQLDILTDDVVARNPDNRQVQRLQRLREVHDMAELRVEAYTGKSFGGGSNGDAGAVSGSRDWGIESRLYTPPIDEDWRLFAGAGYARATFEEGTGQHRWQVVGVERRTRDMTIEAEVSNHSYGDGSKQGAAVSIARDINDTWQYGGSLGYLLSTTPLRALNDGITANGGSGFIRWRANESREWKLTLSPSHFSDGNDRFEALLSGREGLYSSPKVQVDLGLEVGASRNSKEDTIYFNPKSDFTVLPVLNINHVLYHRYETQWSQQFQVGAGTYSQRDYSTGGIGLVGYGQRYRWNDVLDAGANLSLISRPYDGNRERDLRLLVDLTYRF
ncbi:poly-beta-1,6 N-acetyl-D-glucosamine export porin PgaA [Pseudomonas azotoformans]|uniref:Poly-beta-1,6 N-acetyl-D-glucosamine export porin PgaA n=1 Tax=Pseudomonas azotoformans TaxID=47878 RepID=A0A1V2JFN7_PSEAZ|nr:poly-beta-1,6 N-acetyl-D-glucosamine export porin PgaA [Pseudomonas azotoformans]OIN51622.1 poly-beta-1,6 N-acetyl-D-glucosamine export porin PgaA [Pseudomonas azotoformans]ONH43501.1 poly-beta-1,6 N-acetyl-D-glucosamine export porin PgaA [Pseudomonas azotoformans]SDO41553.1 biofilm PGA synthesis protein PgaA [Pseudomonas azotoformans]